jgi:SAM-dependent methyltransferase
MTIEFASFNEWNPADYLFDYYTDVEEDEKCTLNFLVQEFKKIRGQPVVLEFGIGPTIHHLLPLIPYVREIHVADYLESNLEEIRKWQLEDSGSHNWKRFTEKVLIYEGIPVPNLQDINRRETLVRQRIIRYLRGDASLANPISNNEIEKYEFILSCYCADSSTNDKSEWFRFMSNIISLLKPGGFFVTTALRNCQYYKIGDKYFPSANVNEEDIENLFRQNHFDMATTIIKVESVSEHINDGYESIVLAYGFKLS